MAVTSRISLNGTAQAMQTESLRIRNTVGASAIGASVSCGVAIGESVSPGVVTVTFFDTFVAVVLVTFAVTVTLVVLVAFAVSVTLVVLVPFTVKLMLELVVLVVLDVVMFEVVMLVVLVTSIASVTALHMHSARKTRPMRDIVDEAIGPCGFCIARA